MCNAQTCAFGGFCLDIVGDEVEECVCDFNCTSFDGYSVCASDGNIYETACHMDLASCQQQKSIYELAPLHLCYYYDECGCNRVGAYDSSCNALGECRCRPGVGGAKCDHCVPGFWGIHLIAKGAIGCRPCGCSVFGSSRLDCEQSTGRCQCKRDSFGLKCDTCNADSVITANGCMKKEEFKAPKYVLFFASSCIRFA
ncbi:unnamed protein product [Toxocara canis]|uniref:Laminin EGF-like domain-containing protein n=1 Tax=Toxocara canis TaxID=6265 RepID=A0A183VHD1_TOXCA|nr:unnamed protein product [Toxocara canis]